MTAVDTETGEVVPSFQLTKYVAQLSGGLQAQHTLAAAYDAAVSSLVGPNDVQVEGGRTFKKKSAWRKLARHFCLDTSLVRESLRRDGETFTAIVVMRASAPWGQSCEAIGACGSDEQSGRRKITTADALATAQTRATNRAISDLIAMGEVSADEVTRGQPEQRQPAKKKFTPIPERTDEQLVELKQWADANGNGKLADEVEAEQERRRT